MPAQYQIHKSASGRFHFNLTANNNKVILTSESYTSRVAALKGIRSVRHNGPIAGRYERRRSRDGQDYYVLVAANKEVVGRSEMYRSKTAMEKGIRAVRRVAAKAALVEV